MSSGFFICLFFKVKIPSCWDGSYFLRKEQVVASKLGPIGTELATRLRPGSANSQEDQELAETQVWRLATSPTSPREEMMSILGHTVCWRPGPVRAYCLLEDLLPKIQIN